MNIDDAEDFVRLLGGSWPVPAMGEDETAVWYKALDRLDLETCCLVLDDMVGSGRPMRPAVGELVLAYRQKRSRTGVATEDRAVPAIQESYERPCSHPDNWVACRESTEYWLAKIRKQLAEFKGPLGKSMKGATA